MTPLLPLLLLLLLLLLLASDGSHRHARQADIARPRPPAQSKCPLICRRLLPLPQCVTAPTYPATLTGPLCMASSMNPSCAACNPGGHSLAGDAWLLLSGAVPACWPSAWPRLDTRSMLPLPRTAPAAADGTCKRCVASLRLVVPVNAIWLDAGYPETQVGARVGCRAAAARQLGGGRGVGGGGHAVWVASRALLSSRSRSGLR